MRFEYDPAKSQSNRLKHDIDFEQAQQLWNDERMIEAPAFDRAEPRRMAIGQVAGKVWTAVYTIREEAIRLISVRRARESEIERYESDDN